MQRVEAIYKQAIIFNIAATGKHPIPDPAVLGEEVKAPGCSQINEQNCSCASSLTHRGSEGLEQPWQCAQPSFSSTTAGSQLPEDDKALVRCSIIKNKPQNSIFRLLTYRDYC